jgi:predicted DNA-binding protein (UPF0251 family)
MDDDSEEFMSLCDDDDDFIPERYVTNVELSRKLEAVIDDLPHARREAVLLYYYDDLSYEEIANMTGKTTQTVGTNLMKARKMIKEKLLKEYPEMSNMGGGATSLGKALATLSVVSVPDATVKVAGAKGVAHLIAYKSTLALQVATVAVMGVAVMATATYGVTHDVKLPEAASVVEAAPVVVAEAQEFHEAWRLGEIAFSGGVSDDNHINPTGAFIEGLTEKYEAINWSVLSQGGGVISSGEGENPNGSLTALPPGVYSLKYDIFYTGGWKIYKERDFEVV